MLFGVFFVAFVAQPCDNDEDPRFQKMSTTFVEHKRVYGSTYVPHYRNGMDEIIEVFDIPSFLP